MNAIQTRIYEFGEFRVDAGKRLLLRRDGEAVPLKPKVYETLLYLIENGGKVLDKDELLDAIWADTIVEENNLTQNISILRRVLGEKHGENRFIVTVPGRGYKFVADVREVPISEFRVSSSAESENTNSEFQKEDESEISYSESLIADESDASNTKFQNESENEFRHETRFTKPEINQTQSPKNESRKSNKITVRFWLATAIVLSVLAIGFYLRRAGEKAADAPVKTVAVLRFKPLVAETRDEALELGMAETLIAKLSGGEEITVRPLSAIRRYKSVEQDSLSAGRELNAEAVLDGTIQTAGDRIRISARLIRTSDGKQLWAEKFDEKFTDIFDIQDSISERVAAALKIRLGGAEKKRPTENVEAYQLYMRGRFHASRLTQAETEKGIEYLQQAIAIEPNYALAYVGLVDAYHPMVLSSGMPSEEIMPKAKAAALKAIEIDEHLAEAHAALGRTVFWYEWDWLAAEKHYRRALELDPNSASVRFSYAHLLSNTGRHEPALFEIRRARELEPLNLVINALEGQFLFFAGKPDEALDRLKKTIDLDSNLWLSHLFISRVYTEKGMHAEAAAAAKKAGEISGNSQSDAYRAYALARWGKQAEARTVLNELLKLSETRYVPPYNFAVAYNGLGESGKALDYLKKGFAEKDVKMVFLKVEPKWNNLRSEPRFIDLMRRMNFQ